MEFAGPGTESGCGKRAFDAAAAFGGEISDERLERSVEAFL